jgi:hypothetical protein
LILQLANSLQGVGFSKARVLRATNTEEATIEAPRRSRIDGSRRLE